ncbi:ABC transporter ATP-binding protein [Aquisalimonas asiatica]|uniref:Iron(III) transport system ATP-binding protein n=1 Tax=Aquisalimonas asiatica TaxID=406100 RepID=A0A1H8VJR0_9GAMM|nr:ABC transporter ATP-binding protein [Aquisalimonas asiatica]SEP15563.1 iron(III) transport system ATP-binding protein [Aquisalimonas asiatica]
MVATPISTRAVQSESENTPVLAVQGVSRAFGNLAAVTDVDLTVHPHEVVCLLGPSGCGKTTLLRIAAGLESLHHGRVALDGQIVADEGRHPVPPERRSVGLVFQDSALFPHLSVADNVAFGLKERSGRLRQERVLGLLEQLRIGQYADSFPHTLSGGQQQRVALARALAPAPRLMLLDEPFSSLDARLRNQIRDDTLHLLKDSGTGTLMVTHDPEEALFMADRIALMRDGRIVQIGTPMELYCQPRDPFVVTFFGDVNEFFGDVRGEAVETPVGHVDATGMADGTRVRVMIRPEAVNVTVQGEPDGRHDRSHVVMSKLLGASSLVHLCAHDEAGRESHLHARMPGVFLPARNQPVDIRLDPSQAFVFPLDDQAAGASPAAPDGPAASVQGWG